MQETRRADGQIYYTATQGIWTRGLQLHALCAITVNENDDHKSMWTNGHVGYPNQDSILVYREIPSSNLKLDS